MRTRNKWQLTKNFFYGIYELFRLKKFSYIFFNNTDKRTNYGGAAFDIYYDAWADIVGQNKSLFIEWAIQKHLPSQNVHSENVISDMPFKLCTTIFSKVSKVKIDGEHILKEILSKYINRSRLQARN